ncbi:MAG: hypothetical protein D6725_18000 [Planctomycetota bacterium]|nr:MAG: hypothetical protein D6725_18000 [Planctomycetota bacterium]
MGLIPPPARGAVGLRYALRNDRAGRIGCTGRFQFTDFPVCGLGCFPLLDAAKTRQNPSVTNLLTRAVVFLTYLFCVFVETRSRSLVPSR